MKVSAEWLSDFVNLDGISPGEIAEELTVHTAEVDGVEIVRRDFREMVVAEVLRVEPLPAGSSSGSRPVSAVTVDIGGARRETVCGAPDVRVGMKAVFAMEGARLANGEEVRATSLGGRPSAGVLCSPAEIGVGTYKDGLLELPGDLAAGTAVASVLPSSDVLIEIDNKSLTNRPDLWGHYGFARELGAIFGRPLGAYPLADLQAHDELPAFEIAVEDTDGCPLYSAIVLELNGNPVSPARIQARLLTLGTTPISALVDVTNYVQFEIGQPTHAFDARAIDRVRVARAGSRADFVTLDGKTRRLLPDDLLIHGATEPMALAGIMGGNAGKVEADTTRIVLESASFRASRVRSTSVRLALRTDASLRFEKKLPPVYARLAVGRIVRELELAGLSPRALSRYSHAGDFGDRPRTISIAPGWLSKRAGASIDDATAMRLLGAIGMRCEEAPDGRLQVEVPSFRGVADISIPEDISEEVMRLYGYDNIVATPPLAPMRPAPIDQASRSHHRMRRVLSEAQGFVEVQTYGWLADDWIAKLGYQPKSPLLVRNPIVATRRQMRDTLVPNLLSVAAQNSRQREAFRIYEIGRVFWMGTDGQKREDNELCGLVVEQGSSSPVETLRALRSAVEDVAAAANCPPLSFVPVSSAPEGSREGRPWIVPGHTLEIRMGDTPVGHLGLVPPELSPHVLTGGNAAWFSCRTPPLEGHPYPATRYAPLPQFPASWQDFTFTWPVRRGYVELVALLDTFGHPGIEERSFVTMFQPRDSDTARYSFRYVLRWADRSPSAADIEDFRGNFLRFVGEKGLVLA